MQAQRQINKAVQSMSHFSDYYQGLVDYFHHNTEHNLDYTTFARRTNRATEALICEQEAIFYMVAYGWQHFKNISNLLLSGLDVTTNVQSHVRVIDYGCGQGIATLAFMNYLVEQGVAQDSEFEIHLIEPSAISLGIAKMLVERLTMVNKMKIIVRTQQSTLDEMIIPDETTCTETIHLMSNVLDIKNVQETLPALAKKMETCQGQNFVLALSPDYRVNNERVTETGFRKLCESMPFVSSMFCDCSYITNYIYRVIGGSWQSHSSYQCSLMLSWTR